MRRRDPNNQQRFVLIWKIITRLSVEKVSNERVRNPAIALKIGRVWASVLAECQEVPNGRFQGLDLGEIGF